MRHRELRTIQAELLKFVLRRQAHTFSLQPNARPRIGGNLKSEAADKL
jgi:hypothetical protein